MNEHILSDIKQRLHWEFCNTDGILSLASQWLLNNTHIKENETRGDLKVKSPSVHCNSFWEEERSHYFDLYCHLQYEHTL